MQRAELWAVDQRAIEFHVLYDSCVRHSRAGMVSISAMHGPMSEFGEGLSRLGCFNEGRSQRGGHDTGWLMQCVHQAELCRAAKKRKLRFLGPCFPLPGCACW
jgi:hypothetical protein